MRFLSRRPPRCVSRYSASDVATGDDDGPTRFPRDGQKRDRVTHQLAQFGDIGPVATHDRDTHVPRGLRTIDRIDRTQVKRCTGGVVVKSADWAEVPAPAVWASRHSHVGL